MSKHQLTTVIREAKLQDNRDQRNGQDAYRAPRLVDLGSAVTLVQGAGGLYWDGNAKTMVRY